MLVSVIYNENKNCGTVHFSRLESLISSGMIFAFRRTHEWVIIEPAQVSDDENGARSNSDPGKQ